MDYSFNKKIEINRFNKLNLTDFNFLIDDKLNI
jgi:hypothetical protein